MAKKPRSRETLYIKNMDVLRNFIELASYGAYSREQMKDIMDNPATYDKRIGLLTYRLSEKYWGSTANGKERHYYFKTDAYHPDINFLYPIFSLKTIDIQQIICDFSLLYCLKNFPEKKLISEAMDVSYFLINLSKGKTLPKTDALQTLINHVKEDGWSWDSQFRRRLNDLETYGWIIKKEKTRKDYIYQLAADPLAGLSAMEKQELRQAVAFYSPISLISLLGYDLYSYHLEESEEPWPDLYQIRNINNARIADEDLLYFLLEAIQKKQPITFQYHGKSETGLPLSLSFDEYQRGYLRLTDEKNVQTYRRIHEMTKVKTGEIMLPSNYENEPAKTGRRTITVKLTYTTEEEHEDLIWQLKQKVLDLRENFLDKQHSQCELTVQDPLRQVPWLRTLFPKVRYLADSTSSTRVRDHLIQDTKEVLSQYEK